MRQKDKKLSVRYGKRLKNLDLKKNDVQDLEPEITGFKSARVLQKDDIGQKSDAELKTGRVVEIMSNYLCRIILGDETIEAIVSGRLKQFKSGSAGILAVGDYVDVDVSNAPDYRVEDIQSRKNSLIRYSSGCFQREILLAANIDRLVITSSWKMPYFKPGLVDRYLIIAKYHRITPILLLNKIDLMNDEEELEEALAYYRQIGLKIILSSTVSGQGIEELKEELKGLDSVFSGHSGAGKSSVINALMPGLELLTAPVSSFNEKGKHTTTQAMMVPWDFGGHLIDTPGIKTINLNRGMKAYIPKLFPGFDTYSAQCKFRDCQHIAEAECAVKDGVDKGEIDEDRYFSYLGIMDSL